MNRRGALLRKSWLSAIVVLALAASGLQAAGAQSLQQTTPLYPSDSCVPIGADGQVVVFGLTTPNQDVVVRLSDTTGGMSVAPLARNARSNGQGWYRALFTVSPRGAQGSTAFFSSSNGGFTTVVGQPQCATRSVTPTCVTPNEATTLTGTVNSPALANRLGSVLFDIAGPNQTAGDTGIQPTNPSRGQWTATGKVTPTYKPNDEAFPLLVTFAMFGSGTVTAPPPPYFISIPVTVCPPTPGSSSTTGRGTTSTTTTVRTFNPTVAINPSIGSTGTVVNISGGDFPPNTAVTFNWSRGIGSVTVTSDDSGRITTTLLVMPNDLIGDRTLQASGFLTATANFLVVPGSQQPPGRNGLFFGR